MSEPFELGLLDTKRGLKYFRDVVYGYITVTASDSEWITEGKESVSELDLIDTFEVQRLRRIFQTQESFFTYPGAQHSRFEHVLGVMHLAGKFARTVYTPLYEQASRVGWTTGPTKQYWPSVNFMEEVTRVAALLHDVGHGPFGHTLDRIWGSYHATTHYDPHLTHEDISKRVVTTRLASKIQGIRRSPHGWFEEEEILPEEVAWLIKPIPTDKVPPRLRYAPKVLTGLYNADALDYVVRDSIHSGTPEYGKVDVDRLINTSFLVLSEDQSESWLALHLSSLPALRHYLLARMTMYEAVYFHKTARAVQLELRNGLLAKTLKLIGLDDPLSSIENLDRYLMLDDFYILSIWKNWTRDSLNQDTNDAKALEQQQVAEEWRKLLSRDLPWKEVYIFRHEIPEATRSIFLRAIIDEMLETPKDVKRKIADWVAQLESETETALIRKLGLAHTHIQLLKQLQSVNNLDIVVDVAPLDVRPQSPIHAAQQGQDFYVYDPEVRRVQRKEFYDFVHLVPVKFITGRVYCKQGEFVSLVREAVEAVVKDRGGGDLGRLQDSTY